MHLPETPEDLFEALADKTIHNVWEYKELPPHCQKILKIIHTELTKGTLNDDLLRDTLLFLQGIWLDLNRRALNAYKVEYAVEDEIDSCWIDSYAHVSRMDVYLRTLMSVTSEMPALATDEAPFSPMTGSYKIRGPGD